MAEFILNVLYSKFPFIPIMDADIASTVAKDIREVLENRGCREFFEWNAEDYAETGSDSEREDMVEWGLGLMNEYVTFLEGLSGCKPAI